MPTKIALLQEVAVVWTFFFSSSYFTWESLLKSHIFIISWGFYHYVKMASKLNRPQEGSIAIQEKKLSREQRWPYCADTIGRFTRTPLLPFLFPWIACYDELFIRSLEESEKMSWFIDASWVRFCTLKNFGLEHSKLSILARSKIQHIKTTHLEREVMKASFYAWIAYTT